MFGPPPFELPRRGGWLGRPLLHARQVDSTNRRLLALAREGADEGTVLVADYQSAGRGRRGRRWESPPGSSLMFSLLLRPSRIGPRDALLPMVSAVAVARALEGALALAPTIKWPNDILLGGKKCGGILVESESAEQPAIVIGIGLNVAQNQEALADLPGATSLRLAGAEPVERGALLGRLLDELERSLDDFRDGESPHAAWSRRDALRDREVWVQEGDGRPWAGVARGLDAEGALIVERAGATPRRLRAADVTIRHRPTLGESRQ